MIRRGTGGHIAEQPGFPRLGVVDNAARIAVAAVRAADTLVDEARFVLFTPEATAAFEAAAG
jgi:hypothetical protein